MNRLWFLLWVLYLVSSAPVFAGTVHHCTNDGDAETCLACNIYFESRSEDTAGQVAVGLVTANRVDSSLYPDSFCSVVWQKGQFSWTTDGKTDKVFNETAWEKANAVAQMVLLDHVSDYYWVDVEGIRGRALWYHASYVNPSWVTRVIKVAEVGHHLFYTDDRVLGEFTSFISSDVSNSLNKGGTMN